MRVLRSLLIIAALCALVILAGCSGSNNTLLYQNVSERGGWSTTNFLAFTSFGGNGQKYVYRANQFGNSQVLLTRSDGDTDVNDEGGWQPCYKPDGSEIAFVSRRNGGTPSIFLMHGRDGDRRQLTAVTNGAVNGEDAQPNWNSDGTKVIFATTKIIGGGTGGLDIAMINPDGSGMEYLVDTAEQEQWPCFSPSNAQIAFQRGPIGGPTDIIVRTLGTGAEANITDALRTGPGDITRFEAPWWGVIGATEYIYLHSNRDGDFDLFRIRPDGTGFEQLTDDQRSDGFPVISPDGDRILFTRERELWARDPGPGDGKERRLTRKY